MSTNDHVIGKILFTGRKSGRREKLGEEISNEFKGELVVIGTLKGSSGCATS